MGAGLPDRLDKFQVMQHANQEVDEVRRAEFFRKGGPQRGFIRGQVVVVVEPFVPPGRQQMENAQ